MKVIPSLILPLVSLILVLPSSLRAQNQPDSGDLVSYYHTVSDTFASLKETDLKQLIIDIYQHAQELNIEKFLPPLLLSVYEQLKKDPSSLDTPMLRSGVQAFISWTINALGSRAPRFDAPPSTSPIDPVIPQCCDLSDLLRLITSVRASIGSTDQNSCQKTILSILGDACVILGPGASISSTLKKLYDIINSGTCCSAPDPCTTLFIRQSDIGTGAAGYTITTSGSYIVTGSLTFSPVAANSRALVITASHVILDLGCSSLKQGNSVSGVDAIRVESNLGYITIKNGFIEKFTRAGLSIQSTCSHITIDTITTFSCDVRAIECLSTGIENVTISNCKVFDCGQGLSGDIGILMQGCSRSRLLNTDLHNNGSLVHSFSVVRLDSCAQCDVSNLSILSNKGSLGITGIDMINSNTCLAQDILIRLNTANTAGGVTTGCSLSGVASTHNVFRSCRIIDNNAPSTGSLTGFNLSTGSASNFFNDGEVIGNSAGTITGYQLTGPTDITNNTFIDCLAFYNRATGTAGVASGFAITNGADFGSMLRCIASYNTSTNSVAQGLVFQTGTGGSNWSVEDCEFVRNSGNSNANSYGIRVVVGTTNLFARNKAFNNGTTAGNQLNGLPGGSIFNRNTSNMTGATGPWGNVGIIP